MEYAENIQPTKAKKGSKSDSKENPSNQKWAVLSISSIPLVMTLGNSMLIPVLPVMENEIGISPFQSSMIITIYSIVAILLIIGQAVVLEAITTGLLRFLRGGRSE